MQSKLSGLDAILHGEDCQRLEIHTVTGVEVFVRRQRQWHSAALSLDTQALIEKLSQQATTGSGKIVCFLPHEQVIYQLDANGAYIERKFNREFSEVEGKGLKDLLAALQIPKSKRKDKFRQARHFTKIVLTALGKDKIKNRKRLNVLDLACGRSYLGFVLTHSLLAKGYRVNLTGIDANSTLIAKSREIAATLGWADVKFKAAALEKYSIKPGHYHIAVLLHGCDNLTDEAVRIACSARTPLVFFAPCCHHEFRHSWQEHPLAWIAKYSLLEQRLAEVVTDGFRCLVMEALGYKVNVIRFTEPEVTPKNWLLQGRFISAASGREKIQEAQALIATLGIEPKLASLLRKRRNDN